MDGVRPKDVVPAIAAIAPLIEVSCEDFRSRAKAIRDGQNKLIIGNSDAGMIDGRKEEEHTFFNLAGPWGPPFLG